MEPISVKHNLSKLSFGPPRKRCIARAWRNRRRAYLSELATGFRELDGELSRYLTTVRDSETNQLNSSMAGASASTYPETSNVKPKSSCFYSSTSPKPEIHIASAIPKGERADWIVEKCSSGARSLSWIICERSQDHRKDPQAIRTMEQISQEAADNPTIVGCLIPRPTLTEELLRDCNPTSLRLVLDTTDATAPLAKLRLLKRRPLLFASDPKVVSPTPSAHDFKTLHGKPSPSVPRFFESRPLLSSGSVPFRI